MFFVAIKRFRSDCKASVCESFEAANKEFATEDFLSLPQESFSGIYEVELLEGFSLAFPDDGTVTVIGGTLIDEMPRM